MSEPNNHIGLTVKQIADEKNISVSALSKHLGISNQGVYDVFKRRDIKTDQLESIAERLGVSRKYILDRSENIADTNIVITEKNKVNTEGLGEQVLNKIIEEIRSLKEQLVTKDRQIDKLLDIISQPRNFHNPAAGANMKVLRSEPVEPESQKLGS